jgi:hypothetical protein
MTDLVWEETFTPRGDGQSDHTGWEAAGRLGQIGPYYVIEMYFASDSYGWRVKYGFNPIGDADDPDTAKAIAQRHFNKIGAA